MVLTYLTCTLVAMTTQRFVRNVTYKVAIMTVARTVNFISWSILLFFMSRDVPVGFVLIIVVVQVLVIVFGFNEAAFSPCGVFSGYLERKINASQTLLLFVLQFLSAPIGILLADFYLYTCYTRSHIWDGWAMACDHGPVNFLNVPFYQAFFIEMLGPGLLSATPYYTENKLLIIFLILLQVLLLNIFFVAKTGFFINPLNAVIFLHLYGKGWGYFELFIVYSVAPMLGTWIAVEQFGKRIKKNKEKYF